MLFRQLRHPIKATLPVACRTGVDDELFGGDGAGHPTGIAPRMLVGHPKTQIGTRLCSIPQLPDRRTEVIRGTVEREQRELVIGDLGREQEHLRIDRSHRPARFGVRS